MLPLPVMATRGQRCCTWDVGGGVRPGWQRKEGDHLLHLSSLPGIWNHHEEIGTIPSFLFCQSQLQTSHHLGPTKAGGGHLADRGDATFHLFLSCELQVRQAHSQGPPPGAQPSPTHSSAVKVPP